MPKTAGDRKRRSFTNRQKMECVEWKFKMDEERPENDPMPLEKAASEFGVAASTFRVWISRYQQIRAASRSKRSLHAGPKPKHIQLEEQV